MASGVPVTVGVDTHSDAHVGTFAFGRIFAISLG
jgi:hypothetical protein